MFQINQSNLHLLLPGKISWLVEYMHDDYGLSLQECLSRISHSQLYKNQSSYDKYGTTTLGNALL